MLISSGFRGGARGLPAPPPSSILSKKKIAEGRKAGRASDKKLVQGLDPPLSTCLLNIVLISMTLTLQCTISIAHLFFFFKIQLSHFHEKKRMKHLSEGSIFACRRHARSTNLYPVLGTSRVMKCLLSSSPGLDSVHPLRFHGLDLQRP